jgi:hypothetical protein
MAARANAWRQRLRVMPRRIAFGSPQCNFDLMNLKLSRKRIGAKRNIALVAIMSEFEFSKLAHGVAAQSE